MYWGIQIYEADHHVSTSLQSVALPGSRYTSDMHKYFSGARHDFVGEKSSRSWVVLQSASEVAFARLLLSSHRGNAELKDMR